MSKPVTTLKQKFGLLIFGVLLALVCGEFLARFVLAQAPKPPQIKPPGIQRFNYLPDGRHVYKPDLSWQQDFYSGDKVDLSITYQTNQIGMRGQMADLELPHVLCLGDSFTFGQGCDDSDTYPQQLEQYLNQAGFPVSVLNAGVQGYGLKQSVDLYLAYNPQVVPKVVVLTFFLNDLLPNESQAQQSWSGLIEWLSSWQRSKNYRADIRNSLADLDTLKGELNRAKEHAKANDSELVLLMYPMLEALPTYPFLKEHHAVVATAEDLGIEVVDPLKQLQVYAPERLWVHQSDHHPNGLAHHVVVDVLGDSVKHFLVRESQAP